MEKYAVITRKGFKITVWAKDARDALWQVSNRNRCSMDELVAIRLTGRSL